MLKGLVFQSPQLSSLRLFYRQTGKETHFKLQETTKMQEVLDWYAQHKWIDGRSRMYLKLDGVTIHPEHTPKMLELEDQDVIHLVIKRLVLVPDSTPITIRLRFYVSYTDIGLFVMFCHLLPHCVHHESNPSPNRLTKSRTPFSESKSALRC